MHRLSNSAFRKQDTIALGLGDARNLEPSVTQVALLARLINDHKYYFPGGRDSRALQCTAGSRGRRQQDKSLRSKQVTTQRRSKVVEEDTGSQSPGRRPSSGERMGLTHSRPPMKRRGHHNRGQSPPEVSLFIQSTYCMILLGPPHMHTIV